MTRDRAIGLGVIGLGRGFTLMLPTFVRDGRFRLVAATTPGAEARAAFERDFGGRAHASLDGLLADPAVEAVYVASPHQFHCEHVCAATAAGRHVLVDKPLALTLDEGERMVAAARSAGVHVVVGPSHSFDAPVLKAREIIESGDVGRPRMIHAFNYTDFLYRPRRPEELDTARGGGVVFSQAVHQVDVTRWLAGGRATRVTALTGNWDPDRPTEGAYGALMEFEGGAFASLSYSGYGRFDSDEFMGWHGELGRRKDPADYGRARRALGRGLDAAAETARKRARNYGHVDSSHFVDAPLPDAHEHFGVVIVSCEAADLRLRPDGVEVFGDETREFVALPPPAVPRIEVMDELHDAVTGTAPPLHSAAWGLASLEAAIAILSSARERAPVTLSKQVAVRETH